MTTHDCNRGKGLESLSPNDWKLAERENNRSHKNQPGSNNQTNTQIDSNIKYWTSNTTNNTLDHFPGLGQPQSFDLAQLFVQVSEEVLAGALEHSGGGGSSGGRQARHGFGHHHNRGGLRRPLGCGVRGLRQLGGHGNSAGTALELLRMRLMMGALGLVMGNSNS